MFTDIHGDVNLLLWSNVIMRVSLKPDSNQIDIVTYPSQSMSVVHRTAKAPYTCVLHLADGRNVPVDLSCAEHWGDIQNCFPDECKKWPALGWGNDADGHVEIIGVTDDAGGTIPLDVFRQDIEDFTVYHEA